MTGQDIILGYTHILAASDEMVLAAQENRWEDLINIEANRRRLIGEVTQVSNLTEAAVIREEKEALIRRILAADEKVKVLTENWMAEIQEILKSLNAERKLAKVYETG